MIEQETNAELVAGIDEVLQACKRGRLPDFQSIDLSLRRLAALKKRIEYLEAGVPQLP